jgi:hypothetical protein
MLSQITWEQLVEWMAFAEVEPFDEERADMRAAQITSAIVNVNRAKGASPVSVSDVLLRFGDYEPPRKTWQQLKAAAKAAFAFVTGSK